MNIGKRENLKGWWGGFGGFGLGMQDLLKCFVNEVSRVPIGHEGFSKARAFLIKMLGALVIKALRKTDFLEWW